MDKDAPAITWVIRCESPGKLRAAEQLARGRTAPDTIFTHVATAFPGGVETREIRQHRLGDYFDEVQVMSNPTVDPTSFRLVLRPRKDADRYWKDLMVDILRSVRDSDVEVSITKPA